MKITHEILALYAEGKASPQQRDAVRHYLTVHPEEMENILLMMDDDLAINQNMPIDTPVISQRPQLTMTAAAFNMSISAHHESAKKCNSQKTISQCLDDLLDSL